MTPDTSIQTAYDELTQAIVKAVPEVQEHASTGDDYESCFHCHAPSFPRAAKKPCTGHPITLEDMLRTIDKSDCERPPLIDSTGHFWRAEMSGNIWPVHDAIWNIGHDLAWHRDNAPETIRFLHSLLHA